jgi:phospholipid/cholesterol/gamma-HCH transport system substrate-binding protein
VYGDNLGPHCYSVPFRGISLNNGTSPAASTTKTTTTAGTKRPGGTARSGGSAARSGHPASTAAGDTDVAGLGVANSPQENELVNELAALSLGRSPRSLPDWSSLLIGPLYRGAKVTLR